MNISEKRYKLRKSLSQILAVCINSLVLFGFGTNLGFPTILIANVQNPGNNTEPLQLSSTEISWISSIHLICVPLGCLLSGAVTQRLGRKLSMQLVNMPFITSWLLLYYSYRVEHLYAALCIIGLAGGLMEAPVITYVAEITEPKLRGILAATSSLAIMLGIFMQFFLGTLLYWRTIISYNLAVPICAILLLFIVPESPYWLLMTNKESKAKKSLAWLRGWTSVDAIETEFQHLNTYLTNCQQFKGNQSKKAFILQHYCSRTFIIPYSLISLAFFMSHFSGMATLQTFSVQIFQTFHSPIDSYYATFILGIVEVLGTLICVFCVHRMGRRHLTFISTIGSSLCFLILGIHAYLFNINALRSLSNVSGPESENTWMPAILLILGTLFNHIGIRLLPWVLVGELFSTETRSAAAGISSGTGYVFGFLSNKLFLPLIELLNLWGCYFAYVLITLLGTAILYVKLPETESKSLHDIEMHFSGIQKLSKKLKSMKKRDDGRFNEAYLSNDNINTNTF